MMVVWKVFFDQKKDEYLNGAHNYLFVKRVKNKLIGRDVSGPVEMVIGDNCQIMSKKIRMVN